MKSLYFVSLYIVKKQSSETLFLMKDIVRLKTKELCILSTRVQTESKYEFCKEEVGYKTKNNRHIVKRCVFASFQYSHIDDFILFHDRYLPWQKKQFQVSCSILHFYLRSHQISILLSRHCTGIGSHATFPLQLRVNWMTCIMLAAFLRTSIKKPWKDVWDQGSAVLRPAGTIFKKAWQGSVLFPWTRSMESHRIILEMIAVSWPPVSATILILYCQRTSISHQNTPKK